MNRCLAGKPGDERLFAESRTKPRDEPRNDRIYIL
jgi:hypothetical protein